MNQPFQLDAGNGLRLELLKPDDAPRVYAEIDRSRAHLREWLPWVDAAVNSRQTRAHLRDSIDGFARGEGFSLGLLDGETFVGMIGFHAFDMANRLTSVGYWLGQAYGGKGRMTRAVIAACNYAFKERGINRVTIRCATGNRRSRAIPERLGFVHEGCQREAEWLYGQPVDLEIYGILAREWADLSRAGDTLRRDRGRSDAPGQ